HALDRRVFGCNAIVDRENRIPQLFGEIGRQLRIHGRGSGNHGSTVDIYHRRQRGIGIEGRFGSEASYVHLGSVVACGAEALLSNAFGDGICARNGGQESVIESSDVVYIFSSWGGCFEGLLHDSVELRIKL